MTETSPIDPNLNWVKEQLNRFVHQAKPKNQSGGGLITSRSTPACGRAEAVRQLETIKPILDRLYPDWRTDNNANQYFEFQREYDAAMKLIARFDSQAEVAEKLAGFDASPSITAAGMHPLVWEAARSQWNLGNHAEAVDAVARAVNSMLQRKVGRRDVSESDLLAQAFSKNEPAAGKPRLRFLDEPTDDTAESKRQGVMEFGRGCFSVIRNPLAHLADDEIDLDEQTALESLAAFSLLARWIEQSTLEDSTTA